MLRSSFGYPSVTLRLSRIGKCEAKSGEILCLKTTIPRQVDQILTFAYLFNMLNVPPKEAAAIGKLIPAERYKYFIKKIADQQEVIIIIEKEDSIFSSSHNGRSLIHFWCASEYAEAFLKGQSLQLLIKCVDFDYLGETLYPYIKSNNVLLNIMPIQESTGHVIELEDFSKDLKEYLKEWYGNDNTGEP
jgi:hypothetical protein